MKKKDKTRAVGKYYVKEESREHRVKTKKKVEKVVVRKKECVIKLEIEIVKR